MFKFPQEDIDLFLRAELNAGNPRAFEKIYLKYFTILARYSNFIIKDEDKSKSFVQNVFLKLWEGRANLHKVDNLLPYMLSMIRNESLKYLKSESRLTSVPNLTQSELSALSEENKANQNELLEKLLVALSLMPERCRTAFELSRFEQRTNKEIAEQMGISVKSVEALITRSLKFLRKHLSDFLPSPKGKSLSARILMLLVAKF